MISGSTLVYSYRGSWSDSKEWEGIEHEAENAAEWKELSRQLLRSSVTDVPEAVRGKRTKAEGGCTH
jgi:hypothetical protein